MIDLDNFDLLMQSTCGHEQEAELAGLATHELRAARVCVERLRDHLAAFRDQQFLGNHDYDAAEKELLAYDEACK